MSNARGWSRRSFLLRGIALPLTYGAPALVGMCVPEFAVAQTGLEVIAIVSAALQVISAFVNKGDGGLGAMLNATLEYQRLAVALLTEAVKQLINIQQQINDLRNFIPIALEDSRIKLYYDAIHSVADNTADILKVYNLASKSEQQKYDNDLETFYQTISQVRGQVDQYLSFDAALCFCLCLALETTLLYRTGRNALVPQRLGRFIAWADAIVDSESTGSLGQTLYNESDFYSKTYETKTQIFNDDPFVDCLTFTYVINDPRLQGTITASVERRADYAKRERDDGLAQEWYPINQSNRLIPSPSGCRPSTVINSATKADLSAVTSRPELALKTTDAAIAANNSMLKISMLANLVVVVRAARLKASNELVGLGGGGNS